MTDLRIAEIIARLAHHRQVDKAKQPYIEHVERVALAVPIEYRAAAWLHDVIEDCGVVPAYLLGLGVKSDTVGIVLVLTRKDGESYESYIERIATSGNRAAVMVKVADLSDNLRAGCPETLKARYHSALYRLVVKLAKEQSNER